MGDKRGIIKNIKPVFCRFDMDDEPERRAWQIIQQLSKGNGEGKNRSYNSIISEAVVGYYDKVTMSHEELLERLEQVIRKEVAAILGVPVQMPSPLSGSPAPAGRATAGTDSPKNRRTE